MRLFIFILCLTIVYTSSFAQNATTYCNPLNLDYGFTPIPNFSEAGRHRATADPVIVPFKGKYYLFSTNQWGYWWSEDLSNWHFISRRFLLPRNKVYDELCAPAVWAMGDSLCVIGSTYTDAFPIWVSTNPSVDSWTIAVDSFKGMAWDPSFLLDDDGRLYLYHGSSNTFPLYGREIDRKTLQPKGERLDLIKLHDDEHGWERFGEYHDNNFLPPFIEGAWVNKHNGKYYLQYGAPGTEFSGYADGVYVSDNPLSGFQYQKHNPFCAKIGGFSRGSGHGATFQDFGGNYWHITTSTINVKNNFERRLALFPTHFDKDGVLWSNTAFGDYPHYLPTGKNEGEKSRFTGWFLLNYQKPVKASSTEGGYAPNFAVDEDIKTYWSAASNKKGEWFESDLGAISTVHAIQINYADHDVDTSFLGKKTDIYHQYRLYSSVDGKKWSLLVDKSQNKTDVPHDYIALKQAIQARYIRLENVKMAAGKFALSGLRVFGKGKGAVPDTVKSFIVLRQENDKRNAWLKWYPVTNAYAYNVWYGVAPDKMYQSIMVHSTNELYLKTMDKNTTYYFCIEAINENGVSEKTKIIKVE
ncbi:MAG: family 43 glycosylhydrolase [Saprospiraceae bacterium]|nr:family 43 glycosylhydrolase [Saprospiraceae bacterium]